MKLSTKLIVSFLVVLSLLLTIGIASQYLNNRVKDRVVEESEKAIEELELSGEIGVSLYQSLISTQNFLEASYRESLDGQSSETDLGVEQAEQRVQQALNNFRECLQIVDNILIRQAKLNGDGSTMRRLDDQVLKELQVKSSIYISLIEQLIPLAKQSYEDGKEFYTVTIEPYFRTNVLPLVDQFRQETNRNLDDEIASLNSELNYAGRILAMATLVAIILSFILAYFLYRSIATPLHVLSVAAQHIGAGNLDERIDVNSGDEIGRLGTEFNKMAESLTRTTVSRNFMDDVIESMADALIVADHKKCIQRVNSATVNMLGYAEEEIIGKPVSLVFTDSVENEAILADPEGTLKNYETTFTASNGNPIPVSLSRALIREGEQKIKGYVWVASDITQRKLAERQIKKSLKEKEILLAEIHHRVKNNLAVISGLLQMQIWETENEATEIALKDSQLRVQSIALVHEKLYQSESLAFIRFDKYISDLLVAIDSTYITNPNSIKIETNLNEVVLNINQAIPCALLLNEFVINAYKHAFKTQQNGMISVTLSQRNVDDVVILTVRDNGPGLYNDFLTDGIKTLGFTLIDTLVHQLSGNLQAYNDQGAVFEVEFTREEVV